MWDTVRNTRRRFGRSSLCRRRSPVGSPRPLSPRPPAGMDENVAAALCYLLGVLTGILFLVLEPYNRNPVIRFHAFQSIFAWIAAIVIGIVLNLLAYRHHRIALHRMAHRYPAVAGLLAGSRGAVVVLNVQGIQ